MMDPDTGRALWAELHGWAGGLPEELDLLQQRAAREWLARFGKRVRAPGCDCGREWGAMMLELARAHYLPLRSRHAACEWVCVLHDRVNARLGKPLHLPALSLTHWAFTGERPAPAAASPLVRALTPCCGQDAADIRP